MVTTSSAMTDLIQSSTLYPKTSTSRMLSAYEISDDLQRRRVEVLERRYGGREVAHAAATLIQRTFRDWSLNRRFQHMMMSSHGHHSQREAHMYHPMKSYGALPARNFAVSPLQRIAPPLLADTVRSRSITTSRANSRYTPSTSLLAQLRADRSGTVCSPPTTLLDDNARARSGTRSPPSPAPQSRHRMGGSNMIESLMSPRLVTRRLIGTTPPGGGMMEQRGTPPMGGGGGGGGVPSPLLMSPVEPMSPSAMGPPLVWVPRASVPYPLHPLMNASSSTSSTSSAASSTTSCTTTPSRGAGGASGGHPPPPGLIRQYQQHQYQQGGAGSGGGHLQPAHHNSLPRIDKRERRERYEEQQRQLTDVERKRQYRVALNFFNKNPNRGVQLLTQWGFVDDSAESLAKLMFGRRGLSKQMIGEYLGQHEPFHTYVLDLFISQIDVHGLEVDAALRKVLSFFRLPGESQKIDRIMDTFSKHYARSNPTRASTFTGGADTIHVLVYAMIMLQTSLHNPAVTSSARMTKAQFVKLLHGADTGASMDKEMLSGIYDRIRAEEFKQGEDHVTQVQKVEVDIVGKDKPRLSECHRRLVCYCRLHSIIDPSKRQSDSAHERDVYLFNDMLVVTKSVVKKKARNGFQYMLKSYAPLLGARIKLFSNAHFQYGIDIDCRPNGGQMYFAAKNHDDRIRFVNDVHEAILECAQMEAVRLELELGKQHPAKGGGATGGGALSSSAKSNGATGATMVAVAVPKIAASNGDNVSQRDSGLPDVLVDDLDPPSTSSPSDTSSSGASSSSLTPADCSSSSMGVHSMGGGGPDAVGTDTGARSSSGHRASALLYSRRLSFNSLDSGMIEEQYDTAVAPHAL